MKRKLAWIDQRWTWWGSFKSKFQTKVIRAACCMKYCKLHISEGGREESKLLRKCKMQVTSYFKSTSWKSKIFYIFVFYKSQHGDYVQQNGKCNKNPKCGKSTITMLVNDFLFFYTFVKLQNVTFGSRRLINSFHSQWRDKGKKLSWLATGHSTFKLYTWDWTPVS